MRIQAKVVSVLAAVFFALFATDGVLAQEPKAKGQPPKVTKLELSISKDGRAIVDQDGKIVARFVNKLRVKSGDKGAPMSAQTTTVKLQGCMCCSDECVIYDRNGNCIRTHRSCTWSFDCSC